MENFLSHAMNDEHIKLKLAKHGYDADKIRSYHDLYLLANDAYIDLNKEYGEAVEATSDRDKKVTIMDE